MSNINKQALLIENGQLVADTLRHLANNEIDSDYFAIVSESENGTEIEQELAITDYAMQAAGTVGELVKALESAQELVELQRFKIERQAEDLHQAKSLESIHRDKRFEVEREFSSYKDNAERNTSRLAQEVCRLEDELEVAEKRIAELERGSKVIKCWSCQKGVTVSQVTAEDGYCPSCNCSIDLEDYETAELVAAGIITKVGE